MKDKPLLSQKPCGILALGEDRKLFTLAGFVCKIRHRTQQEPTDNFSRLPGCVYPVSDVCREGQSFQLTNIQKELKE